MTGSLGDLFDQYGITALGAGTGNGLVPGGELALRITVTAVEDLAPTRLPFFDVTLFAVGTLNS
jgi:hypothetical protein